MNFFKIHKPLVYKYKPIYYDPKKEAMKERQKQKDETGATADDGKYRPSVLRRGAFRDMADKNRTSRSSDIKKSNVRLIIIILILFLIAYFLVM